jgi:threonine dehydratase
MTTDKTLGDTALGDTAVGDIALNIEAIHQARANIAGLVRQTPMVASPSLSEILGQPVLLKFEHQQTTGSFKLRGASNAVACLSDSERAAGILAVSTGNHGRGLAHAARLAGIRCVICMSSLVPEIKRQAIAALGAEIIIAGDNQDDAERAAIRLGESQGLTYISPFDDLNVIAGQGTLGLEIATQAPEALTIISPLSGGGLLAGIAIGAKSINREIQVLGVSMALGPAMVESLSAGKPVPVDEVPTLADSLSGSIGLDNRYSFDLVRAVIAGTALVTEAEIAAGIRHAYWSERQVIEGGAAVGIAALLTGKVKPRTPVVVVLSGGNINMKLHHRIISGEDVAVGEE